MRHFVTEFGSATEVNYIIPYFLAFVLPRF